MPSASRLADLGRRHDHHALDRAVGDRVHDAALVLGAAGAPLPGLGARLRAQPAVGVGPVTDRELRRRPQDRQRRRTAVASRSGPVRISGDDRRRGELVERLADRFADLVADPGNRRLLVAERGQRGRAAPAAGRGSRASTAVQAASTASAGRSSPRRPSASISARSALALISRAALGAEVRRAGLRLHREIAQVGDVAAHRARRGRTGRARPSGSRPRGSAAGCGARSGRAAARSRRSVARSSPRMILPARKKQQYDPLNCLDRAPIYACVVASKRHRRPTMTTTILPTRNDRLGLLRHHRPHRDQPRRRSGRGLGDRRPPRSPRRPKPRPRGCATSSTPATAATSPTTSRTSLCTGAAARRPRSTPPSPAGWAGGSTARPPATRASRAGLPYLTGWVTHFGILAETAD